MSEPFTSDAEDDEVFSVKIKKKYCMKCGHRHVFRGTFTICECGEVII